MYILHQEGAFFHCPFFTDLFNFLTTKLYCGKCKSFMVGESGASHKNNKVHRYYKCVGVKYHRGCDKKTVKKDWIENLVIKVIKDIIFDDNLINNLADTLIEALDKESTVFPLLKKALTISSKASSLYQQRTDLKSLNSRKAI